MVKSEVATLDHFLSSASQGFVMRYGEISYQESLTFGEGYTIDW